MGKVDCQSQGGRHRPERHTGTASKFGVDVAWNYVPGTQELTFQCLSTPFFVKPQDVYAKIQALVKETVASDSNS